MNRKHRLDQDRISILPRDSSFETKLLSHVFRKQNVFQSQKLTIIFKYHGLPQFPLSGSLIPP